MDSTSKEDEMNWLTNMYFLYLACSYTKSPSYYCHFSQFGHTMNKGVIPTKVTNGSGSNLRYRAFYDGATYW